MKCEVEGCKNRAKFVVAPYGVANSHGEVPSDSTVGVCHLHIQWGMRNVSKDLFSKLFFVGLIDSEATL